MNQSDYFRYLTQGIKFKGKDNLEVLKRFKQKREVSF